MTTGTHAHHWLVPTGLSPVLAHCKTCPATREFYNNVDDCLRVVAGSKPKNQNGTDIRRSEPTVSMPWSPS